MILCDSQDWMVYDGFFHMSGVSAQVTPVVEASLHMVSYWRRLPRLVRMVAEVFLATRDIMLQCRNTFQASVCITFAKWQCHWLIHDTRPTPVFNRWRDDATLNRRGYKILWPIFQPITLNTSKSSETKFGRFSEVFLSIRKIYFSIAGESVSWGRNISCRVKTPFWDLKPLLCR
jgi:hypothetical protein